MIYIIIGIAAILFIFWIFKEEAPDHTYNASFGSNSDHLSRFNQGFSLGAKALTKKVSETNCALFGPTGSGKSSSVIISSAVSLARGKSSIIFNDVSGEIWENTSGFLSSKGYTCLRLNFSDPEHSESFNPLAYCHTISDIQKLALIVIRNSVGENKSDPFWENSSMMLLSLMARYLVFHAAPEFRTMQNVLRMVEKFSFDGPAIDKLFSRTNNDEILNSYKATVVMPDKTLQSVISTLRTSLSLWIDPAVCITTATNTIDLNMLREKPVAIYLNTPLKDLMYYKPISALFIQTLFNHVMAKIPGKDARSIFFVVDEFGIYQFPSFTTTISNIRKFKSGILLCVQDEMALISKYGQADAHQIKTNCGCHIFLKGQPLSTCKDLSQILGRYTYEKNNSEKTRELLTPDEIRMCEDAIVLIGNKAPLMCKMVPHYKNIWIRRFTQMPPLESQNTLSITTPPLIQF